MAHHKVEIAGVDTSSLKVLTSEETNELFKKMEEGNPFARNDLISGNLKLVLSIVKNFRKREEELDDLFQVGCVGLVKAIDNFDRNLGVKLSTYAVPMILGEIKRYIRDNNSIRVSRSVKDLAYLSLKVKEEMTNRLDREVTIKEIADVLEKDESEIINALESVRTPTSIFEPIYNDGGETIYLFDQIEDKSINTDLDNQLALEEALNDLNDREKQIIDERYIIGKTQMEIADELGISQAQISRLEKDAIYSLKKVLKY